MDNASLVLGIVGLFAWFLPIIGLPVNITGLILGVKSKSKATKNGKATAGIVMTIIGLAATIVNASIGAFMGSQGLF